MEIPITLEKKYVEKYQKLYKKQYGEDIDYQEAYDQLLRLVVLVQETYKPMTQKELDEVMEDKRRIREKYGRTRR